MKKELETQILAVRICCQDIGMEFGFEKCAMLVMKSGKRHLTDGMELRNQEKISTLGEKKTDKYLGDIGSWQHQTSKNERKKLRKSISEKPESYWR